MKKSTKKAAAGRAVFIAVCAALTVFFMLSGVFSDGGYSPEENRTLAERPEFSLDALLSGEALDPWEEWLKDNVPARSMIIRAGTAFKLATGEPGVGGVYRTAGGVLLPVLDPVDTPSDDEIASVAARYAGLADVCREAGSRLVYVGLRGQISEFIDEYPDWLCSRADWYDAVWRVFPDALRDAGVTFISGDDILTRDDYMRSDHHLTLPGAYKVYAAVCAELGVDALPEPEYRALPNPFNGSRSRRLYGLSDVTDSLLVCDLPAGLSTGGATVFALPANDTEPVTYDLYMGGDVAEEVIDTGRDGLPSVLVYGDSYTNAVECFVWQSFGVTYSYDLRHYDGSLADLVTRLRPDAVVCIRDDGSWLGTDGNGKVN